MKKVLRPYQKECMDELKAKLKETTDPVLVVASVGAGKSLIIAELLLLIEKANYRALCLTLNSDLIRQNVKAYQGQGGHASIYCAALDKKEYDQPVVFASPHSIHAGLKVDPVLKELRFNIIIIDEAHNVNINDKKSMYIRLINHYGMLAQTYQYSFRIVGLTGTPFRGKGIDIVGEEGFFKHKVGNITTAWLIEHGYLVEPYFGIPASEAYDFSNVRLLQTGKFDGKQLQDTLDKQQRLTGKIMQEVVKIVSKRNGAFIFASTVKHCEEVAASLPIEQTAIITGDTPPEVRNSLLNLARGGIIKYLVNVNVLTVGVDVPNFDTVVMVRLTESLVLYTQALGRGLRLHDDKNDCLVLDYAGNLDRHGNVDNPIINKALRDLAKDDPEYCIPCFDCGTMNTMHARRCIGLVHKRSKQTLKDDTDVKEVSKDYDRCEHFFEFKQCHKCEAMNDKVSRYCRACKVELIDPNAKLSDNASSMEKTHFKVLKATYNVGLSSSGESIMFRVFYTVMLAEELHAETFGTHRVVETYSLVSAQSKNLFYHKFLKVHHDDYTKFWIPMNSDQITPFASAINASEFRTPSDLECTPSEKGTWKIVKKHFIGDIPDTTERRLHVIRVDLSVNTRAESKKHYLFAHYSCVDENKNFMMIRDHYLFNGQSSERLKKDFPVAYMELINVENLADKINIINQSSMKYLPHPNALIVDRHCKILKRFDNMSSLYDLSVFNNPIEYFESKATVYYIDQIMDSKRQVFNRLWNVFVGQNHYKIAHTFLPNDSYIETLYKNHQIESTTLECEGNLTPIYNLDFKCINGHVLTLDKTQLPRHVIYKYKGNGE